MARVERAAECLDYTTASETLAAAAAAARQSERERQRLPEILGEHALIMRRSRRYGEALALVREAIAEAERLHDVAAQARWTGLEGNLHRLRKALSDAESAFTRARSLFAGSYTDWPASRTRKATGVFELDRGHDRAAEYAYRRAVEIAEAAGAHDAAISTFATNLGNALTRRRRYRQAWAMYERAMIAAAGKKSADSINYVAMAWRHPYRDAHRSAVPPGFSSTRPGG